jgi:hypothetical protein
MEFSSDIWKEIVGYFHSSYKRPSHYDAIMDTEHFRNRRRVNRRWNLALPIEKNGLIDSYYIYIVFNAWIYWSASDIQHLLLPPDVNLCRKVARGSVKTDFDEIWRIYADAAESQSVLSLISY